MAPLSKIHIDADRLPKCEGCRIIEALLMYWNGRETSPAFTFASIRPVRFHDSFEELHRCADKCVTCRLIRRAVILKQPTVSHVDMLLSLQRPAVWASLAEGPALAVFLSPSGAFSNLASPQTAFIALGAKGGQLATSPSPNLTIQVDHEHVYKQVREWARLCHRDHVECGNLAWSSRNPSRLLQIQPGGQNAQLVTMDELVPYVALSYCWGPLSPGADGATLSANVEERLAHPIDCEQLPQTIRDAIFFTWSVGISYIWVDSVCIVQDDTADWTREAGLMHQVYANAHFTICASSVDRASAGLFQPREAWRHASEPCHLNSRMLTVTPTPLRSLNARSIWSSRGWTLQEEILSPRILYWTPHSLYWSCGREHRVETPEASLRRIPSQSWGKDPLVSEHETLMQGFLLAARSGVGLYERWLDVVEYYSRRDLTRQADRYHAISGLAARYQHRRPEDSYLAGLWQTTLAQDLCWTVETAVPTERDHDRTPGSPSWSWVTLPTRTPLKTRRCEVQGSTLTFGGPEWTGLQSDAVERVQQGSSITSISLQGRLRPLCGALSIPVPWEVIAVSQQDDSTTGPSFSFKEVVEMNVHAVELRGGKIVVYEPRMLETVAQLDYLSDVYRICSDPSSLFCLDIGSDAMLLVEMITKEEQCMNDVVKYKRVGISTCFRSDFFSTGYDQRIVLV
jgi:hypothetical protein